MTADENSPIELIKYIAGALCSQPDKIEVESRVDERGMLVELFVAETDLGRVIGKAGETANAIRAVLRALGTKNNARYGFKIQSRQSVESIDVH